METWAILSKLAVLMYIMLILIQQGPADVSLAVLLILLYVSANMAAYLVRGPHALKGALSFLPVLVPAGAYFIADHSFILLLPVSILEFLNVFYTGRVLLIAAALAPLFYVDQDMQPLYGLTALLTYVSFLLIRKLSWVVERDEHEMNSMRKSIHSLTRNVNMNSEYIRQSEYTYRLEERNRISQEIHDQIGHAMTGALIQMEAAKRLMGHDRDKAEELLQNAICISKSGIEDIRLTLKNLKPPLEQVGIHRLKLVIDDFSAKSDIEPFFVYKGNLDIITPIQWRIIQENLTEALTNTMKYAGAARLTIEIHVLNKLIRAVVKDDGKGGNAYVKGLGILGMEERAAALDGKVIVDGTDGFSVTTLLPIK
ncbi:sensor histidine kinase [Peribacillus sp. SCS-26]|uniref:sensor histidine kinase n=1 Tax=Paraperibacillus marinus TaxID=3115295 RepID=UPI0039064C9F